MKKCLIIGILCLFPMNLLAKTFFREYTYNASEADSKITSRANALEQVKRILLEEIGVYIHSTFTGETTEINGVVRKLTAEEIEVISAGITETEIMEECWDGKTFYIKARIKVDKRVLHKRLASVTQNKELLSQLQESRKRVDEALAEIEKLKRELEKNQSKKEKRTLQRKYIESCNKLSAEDWLQKGWNAHQLKELDNAILYYKKSIALNPNQYRSYFGIAYTCHHKGHYDEAIEWYKDALKLNPNISDWNVSTHYQAVGHSYLMKKDYDMAMKYYKKALNRDPNNYHATCSIGEVYLIKENYLKAIEYFQKAIKKDPNRAEGYHSTGKTYHRRGDFGEGDFDKAIEWYQKAIELDPSGGVYHDIGAAYYCKGDYDKAIEYYEKAIELDPKTSKYFRKLGNLYFTSRGDYDKAMEYYQKTITINPDDGQAYYNMGMVYAKKGNNGKLVEFVQKSARLGHIKAQVFLRKRGLSW